MDLHQLVSALKQEYANEGKLPSRQEFTDKYCTRGHIIKIAGGWTELVKAAGLHIPHGLKKEKIPSEVLFYKDVSDHIEKYEPRDFKSPVIDKKILVIGDVHAPFTHKEAMFALYDFAKENQPDYIIQVGDARDQYSFSKFPRSQNIYNPREEELLATEVLREMWQKLKEAAPKAKRVMLLGNHCIRPIKRTLESMPEAEHIIEEHLKKIMTFDEVETIHDSREEYEICGILFHHGIFSGLGQHRDHALQNMVVGHTHKGGVSYRRIRSETLWELNAGFLGDPESKVFSYTAFKKTNNYTLGWGYIDRYGPRFCHY